MEIYGDEREYVANRPFIGAFSRALTFWLWGESLQLATG
jgi:hypothetical protein